MNDSDILFFGFFALAILIILFWCFQSDKIQNNDHMITRNQIQILQRLDDIERNIKEKIK